MKFFDFIICYLCVSSLEASDLYRAGVLHLDKEITKNEFTSFVHEAGRQNVDILLLPPIQQSENYEETVTALSKAAKEAGSYVVAHLNEKTRCQNKDEMVKNNLVFDRDGSLVSHYRKPVSNLSNCTSGPADLVTFNTDFGVTFGLSMHEDIVLHNIEYFKGLRHFVTTGAVDETFLMGPQFFSPWSFVHNVNLMSNQGIYMGRSGLKTSAGALVVADINKFGGSGKSVVPNIATESFTSDFSQYIIKPLDLEASIQGYTETVCHRMFCCDFYVKTAGKVPQSVVSYGFAVLNGVYPFTSRHSIGSQSCGVFSCAGLYKRSCELGLNDTNVLFERISVTANFTTQNAQYPIIQASSVLPTENFKFGTKTNGDSHQVNLQMFDVQNVIKFGIFGRDYSQDFESYAVDSSNSDSTYDIYDYIFNEDIKGFFDYVWIRLRILLVVVSIYVLEMM